MNSTNRRQQNYGSDVLLSYFIDWLKEDLKKPLTLYRLSYGLRLTFLIRWFQLESTGNVWDDCQLMSDQWQGNSEKKRLFGRNRWEWKKWERKWKKKNDGQRWKKRMNEREWVEASPPLASSEPSINKSLFSRRILDKSILSFDSVSIETIAIVHTPMIRVITTFLRLLRFVSCSL